MQHLDDGYLQSWLDRERSGITRAEAAEVEAHAAGCDACAARLAELEETSARARSFLAAAGPSGDAVPDFEEVVRMARGRAPSRRRGRGWTAAGWAASIVFATGLGWLSHDLVRPGAGAGDRTTAAELGSPQAAVELLPVEAERGAEAAREAEDARADAQAAEDASAGAEDASAGEEARAEVDAPAPAAEPLREPPPLVVQGQVRGVDGRPLPLAQVTVPGASIGTLTGEDGTFTLSVPVGAVATAPEQPVTLTAQLLGYRTATRAVDPGAGDSFEVDFLLEEATLALDEVVVTGAARAPVASALRAGQAGDPAGEAREVWAPVTRAEAEAEAGFALLTAPGLAVLEIELGEVGGVAAVRVRQALDSGATLTLVQQPATAPEVEPMLPEGQPVAVVRRGEVRVTGAAPISPDSLGALLGGVR